MYLLARWRLASLTDHLQDHAFGSHLLRSKIPTLFAQTITVSVNVSDPTSADAVAFLVPYSADRNVTAPQKRQWCLNGTAGSDYLTTGQTSLKCAV